MNISKLLIIAFLTLLTAACASSNSGNVYKRDDARKVQTVRTGIVESVRTVQLEGTKSPVGSLAGGVVGGIAGSSVGGGRGSAIASVIGAVLGGLVGSAAEEGLTRKEGIEITVKLDGGAMIAIVQEADEQFNSGDRVRLVENSDTSRVTH